MSATVAPSDASIKVVSWVSNDPAIAAVSTDGTVTALTAGTATITAITADNELTAACTVTVPGDDNSGGGGGGCNGGFGVLGLATAALLLKKK